MGSNIETIWNEEAVAKLKVGIENGDGFEAIATELGCTRNAIAGKAFRLGLQSQNKAPKARRPPKPRPPKPRPAKPLVSETFSPRAAAIVRGRAHKARSTSRAERIIHKQECDAENPPFQLETQEMPIKAPMPATSKTLMQLTENDCRWPLGVPGTPDFRFCGSPTADMTCGRPYCLGHSSIAYRLR